ncbi:hypothetical protein [Actinoallomurus acaciae]|uniref:Translation initiation factor IF-2 n=1 Tax=Actinoallomurus acaciae TaxID=502577 RepID=A0ABV5YEQ5_9ACTN
MAEHDEHDPRESATPAGEPSAPRPEPPAEPAGGGQAPPPPAAPAPGAPPPQGGAQTEFLESGRTPPPYAEGPPNGPSRWRRWSSNGSVRAGALTLVAGLIGGLVGGGIVAAFNHDHGPDRPSQVRRFGPGEMGRGFGPGMRGWAPPNGGWGQNHRMPQPNQPGTPAPAPSPTSSG